LGEAQQVSLASRVGAEMASRSPGLASTDQVPKDVCEAVEHSLNAAGLNACQVIVEHNVGGQPAQCSAGGPCGAPPAAPLPTDGKYVRVTVFAADPGVAAGLLGWIGLDSTRLGLRQSTTFRYGLSSGESRP